MIHAPEYQFHRPHAVVKHMPLVRAILCMANIIPGLSFRLFMLCGARLASERSLCPLGIGRSRAIAQQVALQRCFLPGAHQFTSQRLLCLMHNNPPPAYSGIDQRPTKRLESALQGKARGWHTGLKPRRAQLIVPDSLRRRKWGLRKAPPAQ